MHKMNANGLCPYCFTANNFSVIGQRKPQQMIHKCNICQKFMVFNDRNGGRYPLSNPNDQNSMPNI